MQTSSPARLRARSHVLVRELEGEAVLLNLASERYFGLDEVGTRMWMVLTTCESTQQAVEQLLAEYDADPQVLQQDLQDLVDRLLAHGLVEARE